MKRTYLGVALPALAAVLFVGLAAAVAVGQQKDESALLLVAQETVDLGTLSPGSQARGICFMQSPSSKTLEWSTPGPDGWDRKGHGTLKGRMKDSLSYVEITLKFTGDDVQVESAEADIQMTLECDGETLTLERGLTFGQHVEKMDLRFEGGLKTISLKFDIVRSEPGPLLDVEPAGMDFGTLEGGKSAIKKLRIRNAGKGKLAWKASVRRNTSPDDEGPLKNRFYVSFLNENLQGREEYVVPGRLEKTLQIDGRWLARAGSPAVGGVAEGARLTYSFSGTGVALIIRSEKNRECSVKAFVDDRPAEEIDGLSEEGRAEAVVAANLQEGPHVLTVIPSGGALWIEGVVLSSDGILSGVAGWLDVFPSEGTTRSENYATVTVRSENLRAGLYSDTVAVHSNGGDAEVDVSVRVTRDRVSKIIEVYRYVKGNDYLYTGQPEAEDYDFLKNYRKQRLAFRLFREDTPGTKKFLRWYNAATGDHFYSTDTGGGQSLQGYAQEESIGNIATSRILGTRELYRWRNPSTGRHFYTTDAQGEGMEKRGYRFDGIAGYVR